MDHQLLLTLVMVVLLSVVVTYLLVPLLRNFELFPYTFQLLIQPLSPVFILRLDYLHSLTCIGQLLGKLNPRLAQVFHLRRKLLDLVFQ